MPGPASRSASAQSAGISGKPPALPRFFFDSGLGIDNNNAETHGANPDGPGSEIPLAWGAVAISKIFPALAAGIICGIRSFLHRAAWKGEQFM